MKTYLQIQSERAADNSKEIRNGLQSVIAKLDEVKAGEQRELLSTR